MCAAMRQYGVFIINYLTGMCKDRQMAEDVAQNLWVYVYKSYEPEDYTSVPMLLRKAKLLLIDEIRKKDKSMIYVDGVPERQSNNKSIEGLSLTDEQNLYDRFWEQFGALQLSDLEQEIFWLHERLGYSMKEVGEKLDLPHSTAHDILQRTRSKCLNYINRHG